jgi:hypothetical protein
MWRNFDVDHEMFKFVALINKVRKSHRIYDHAFEEKWVDDHLFAYKRGDVFVAVTNHVHSQIHRDIPNSGYKEGQILCNVFHRLDCVTIKNGILPLYLNFGETKIFVPHDSPFFNQEHTGNFSVEAMLSGLVIILYIILSAQCVYIVVP